MYPNEWFRRYGSRWGKEEEGLGHELEMVNTVDNRRLTSEWETQLLLWYHHTIGQDPHSFMALANCRHFSAVFLG